MEAATGREGRGWATGGRVLHLHGWTDPVAFGLLEFLRHQIEAVQIGVVKGAGWSGRNAE
jgi:hypothetical protein